MSYDHPLLGPALGWKYPGLPRIRTVGHVLVEWPTDIQPAPDDEEQAQAIKDYQAYIASPQYKDDELQRFLDSSGGKVVKAIALVGIERGLWTLADLRTRYRSL